MKHRTHAEQLALFARIAEVSQTVTDIKQQAAAVGLSVPVLYVYRSRARAAGYRVAELEQTAGAVKRYRCDWTDIEVKRLKMLWGEISMRGIAQRMGRTTEAICRRAEILGLPIGLQPGMEYIHHAAQRTGFDAITLRRILKWAGVGMARTMSLSEPGAQFHRHSVDPIDVDDAIEKFMAHELVGPAARRHGIGEKTLFRWLETSGDPDVPPRPGGKHRWLVPSEVIDRVVAKRKGSETVADAARRHGIEARHLVRILGDAGVERGPSKYWYVERDVIDRVVAAQPQARAA